MSDKENEHALNIKLALWAGFHDMFYRDGETHGYGPSGIMYWLQFTTSMDLCLQWLVPRMQGKGIGITYLEMAMSEAGMFRVGIDTDERYHEDERQYLAKARSLPMALCLVIENLIDGKELTCLNL